MGYKVMLDGQAVTVAILARRPHLVVAIDGRRHVVDATCDGRDGAQNIVVDGHPLSFVRAATNDAVEVRLDGQTLTARPVDAVADAIATGSGANAVKAPMPGTVVTVHRRAGAIVRRGEAIITIESMKLQMALAAPRDGTIEELAVEVGDGFEKDAVLARLAPLAAVEG